MTLLQAYQVIRIDSSNKGEILRQVFVPDVGRVVQTKNKGILIQRPDNPELYVTAADFLISCTPVKKQLLQTDKIVKAIVGWVSSECKYF